MNMWYYGVRFAAEAKPSDLWVTYFTSSKKVKMFRKQHGEPDVIEIRQIFQEPEKARLWESKVLQKMDAVKSKKWLNQTDNTHKFYHEGPRGEFSAEHRKKISDAQLGRKLTKEHIKKLHDGRRGSKNSQQHKESIRQYHTGRTHSEATKLKMSETRQGIKNLSELSSTAGKQSQKKRKESGYYNTPEWKEKMKQAWNKRKLRDTEVLV